MCLAKSGLNGLSISPLVHLGHVVNGYCVMVTGFNETITNETCSVCHRQEVLCFCRGALQRDSEVPLSCRIHFTLAKRVLVRSA